MTSQAVMKRYLTAVSKTEEYANNKTIQNLATAIANFKKLEKEQQAELNVLIEGAYKKLQAKGVSVKKAPTKTTTTRKTRTTEKGGLKAILAELKKKLGAEKFKEATTGTDIQKDIQIPALKKGKRIVRKKGYTTNQYGTFKNQVGTAYWESRANRFDANQPSQTRKYKLADGGKVGTNYEIELFFKGVLENRRYVGRFVVSNRTLGKLEEDYSKVISIDVLDESNQKPISYNSLENKIFLKAKEISGHKYAKGGNVEKRVTSSEYVSKEEIKRFEDYVFDVYEEEGYTKEQVKNAVKKYINHLDPITQNAFTWGGGDSLDRERVYEYLLDPKLKHIKNPTFAKGGQTKAFPYAVELLVKKSYGNEGGIIANFKGKGDAMICARALNENSPENYEYSVKESSKYADGGNTSKLTEAEREQAERELREAWEGKNADDYVMYSDKYKKGGEVGQKVFEAKEDGVLGIFSGSDAYSIQISKGDTFVTYGDQDDSNWWYVKKIDKKPTAMSLNNNFDYTKSKSRVKVNWDDLILTFPKGDNMIYAKMVEIHAQGGTTKRIKRRSC